MYLESLVSVSESWWTQFHHIVNLNEVQCLGVPDLANKYIESPVKFEFQIKIIFFSITMSPVIFRIYLCKIYPLFS